MNDQWVTGYDRSKRSPEGDCGNLTLFNVGQEYRVMKRVDSVHPPFFARPDDGIVTLVQRQTRQVFVATLEQRVWRLTIFEAIEDALARRGRLLGRFRVGRG